MRYSKFPVSGLTVLGPFFFILPALQKASPSPLYACQYSGDKARRIQEKTAALTVRYPVSNHCIETIALKPWARALLC